MGDRANVLIKQGESDEYVYLYTHWDGVNLATTVIKALKRKVRWQNKSYLARIIFCEMIKGHESDETGFGISTFETDNSHLLILLNPDKKEISLVREVGSESVFGPVSFDRLVSNPSTKEEFLQKFKLG